MKKISFNSDNKTYLKVTDNIKNTYIIIYYVNDDVAQVISFSNSISNFINIINYKAKKLDTMIIDESDILYSAFDKLLEFDNYLEIFNDEVKRMYNSMLMVRRKNGKILLDMTKLERTSKSSILIENPQIKEKMILFFDELNKCFTRYFNNQNNLKLKRVDM